jgi:hypothetical protein
MTEAMTKKRWVSFYEIYGSPNGDRARLGTGIYEDVFAREVTAPRIGFFFSHVTDAYLRYFATFSRAHFDKSKNEFVCDYGSPFEKMGGPLWLVGMAGHLTEKGLACIPNEPRAPAEGYWVRAILDQQPHLITPSLALAELAGERSLGDALAIHILFQGSFAEIIALGEPAR